MSEFDSKHWTKCLAQPLVESKRKNLQAAFLGQPRNGVAAHCLTTAPLSAAGSEADEGCMREIPHLATAGCDEVLCTAATETSKYHRTCQSTSLEDALGQFTKIMVSNEGHLVKKETP